MKTTLIKARVKIAKTLIDLAEALLPEDSPSVYTPVEETELADFVFKPKGRVVQVTAPAEYDFEKANEPRAGGRVVKLMPRQLKKVKDGQEKPLND